MALYIVPTPLGNMNDLTLRALEVLQNSDVIIVEEFKESTPVLRHHGIKGKPLEQLNEHSQPEDLLRLVELCKTKQVALITDCGTPAFCDPGSDLVGLCRKNKVPVLGLPGPSSLMLALSLAGQRVDSFYFRGFLPAANEPRAQKWQELKKINEPIIIMDTPYRLKKTLLEADQHFLNRPIFLSLNLTQPNEWVFEGPAKQALSQLPIDKAEFVLIVLPK